jgi:DNA-binding NtrC family response regulator
MAHKLRILIVDDERIVRESFKHWFANAGHEVGTAASADDALVRLEAEVYDLLFVDIKMPGKSGLELLEQVRSEFPEATVVIITAYGSIESAVRAMKMGASDYLLKPFKPEQLNLVLEKIIQQRQLSDRYHYLKGTLEQITRFDDIIGRSASMQTVFALIPEVAASDAAVLLIGETGTGKELVAKAIHAKSRRAHYPFVPINCGAMPESLLESELFGHQKGAFTGAQQARKGFLEVAEGGTLFLDEVGEISAKMQVDLLRVLQDKKVMRLGSRQTLTVDFRLISATSRDLSHQIAEGAFREDFFYRINVIQIDIPPLRHRKEDIPLLVEHFLEKLGHETTRKVDRISPAALESLAAYDWPGNVRELENAVERAVVLAKARTLGRADFAFLQATSDLAAGRATLKEMETACIRKTLEDCGGNVTRAAKILGINRVTLHKKIKRLGL